MVTLVHQRTAIMLKTLAFVLTMTDASQLLLHPSSRAIVDINTNLAKAGPEGVRLMTTRPPYVLSIESTSRSVTASVTVCTLVSSAAAGENWTALDNAT